MIRILAIDDNRDMLELMVEMLTHAGYQVGQATTGTDGVKLYRQQPFDLVLTDLFMPDKDGLEVMSELRKDFPNVKMIIFSGNVYRDLSLKLAEVLGAECTLLKPFSEQELLKAVREVLESD